MAKTTEPVQPYRVLARKYRPADFTGLMVHFATENGRFSCPAETTM